MPRTQEAITARFRRLDATTAKLKLFSKKPSPPTLEQEREKQLVTFAQYQECGEAFLPFLRDRLEQLEDEMGSVLRSHADICAVQGKKEEVRLLLKQFEEWRK